MDQELQQLRAFFYAYRLRSLAEAGGQMQLSGAHVGRLIRQLERVLGQGLFDRTDGALHPTRAAEAAISRVEQILADWRQLKVSVHDSAARHVKTDSKEQ